MKKTILAVIVGLTCMSVLAQISSLEGLRQALAAQEANLVEGYGLALDGLLDGLKKKGDLDGYIVVDTEKKRFNKEKSVLSVVVAKGVYSGVVVNYAKARLALLKKYDIALDNFIKAELMADRVENAKAGKEEKEKITFDIVDLESQLPKKEVAKVAETNVVKVVEKKTHPIEGVWMGVASKSLVTIRNGVVNIEGHPELSGTYAFSAGSKTKAVRTHNNGLVLYWEYDAKKDIIKQSNGGMFTRISRDD